jgi:hypothetical protein
MIKLTKLIFSTKMSILKMVMFEYQEKKMTNLQIDTVSSLAFMLQFLAFLGM